MLPSRSQFANLTFVPCAQMMKYNAAMLGFMTATETGIQDILMTDNVCVQKREVSYVVPVLSHLPSRPTPLITHPPLALLLSYH
jgi:hypothetical protein